uniref:Uncharacterized protein n=1 Tax=Amphora coffeiformis TaxID=265554 RepID=A0A7S3PCR8_9STRA|eukprot:scaffold2046_cov171-Amphora_coffeaeformis.AAC.11
MSRKKPTMLTTNNPAMEVIDVAFSDICDFLTFAEALQMRSLGRHLRDLVEECLTEDHCAAFLERKLKRENIYLFHDTREWREATQTDYNILKKVIHPSSAASPKDLFSFRTLLDLMKVMGALPLEAAIGYSTRYGRVVIPQEEQVRIIIEEEAEEEPRSNGRIYDPCPCPKDGKCQGCKLIDNIPIRKERISTEGRIDEEGYSVDDFYTCYRQADGKEVPVELKTYFPVSVPNLPPTLQCPVCRESSRRTLFLTEVSYQSSEPSNDFRFTPLTFTPLKTDEAGSKKPRREDTWRDRLFPKDSYPPAPYREDGVHKNVPIEHTPDKKTCISIHCENCKRFGLLAPAVPCHTLGFPCEAIRAQPQEGSLRDELYQADLGAILVRRQCNAAVEKPCNKATLCTKCSTEVWHHVWEGRPDDRQQHHAYLNNHGINFIVFCSSCRTCDLRLCHEHAWLSTICHHS